MKLIDLDEQYSILQHKILHNISAVLESGEYILGAAVHQLEERLQTFTGAKHCIGVGDGSAALLISLLALGIKAQDEVIVPSFTFVATASMVSLLGAIPVFVDIDPKTYNIDPSKIAAAITKKTAAIIAVNLYGQCADFIQINAIAQQYQLPVIEDAAQSFGASVADKLSCNLSTISTTSFFPSKPLGCYGDGGAIFTNNDSLAAKIKCIRVHGQEKRYHHTMLGINSRLDTLQAAILLAKLSIFATEIDMRQVVAKRYNELLADSCCIAPYITAKHKSVYAQYTIAVTRRDELQQYLTAANIPTAVYYNTPLHLQPIFRQHYRQSLPVTELAAAGVISLPMHPYLDIEVQKTIVGKIKEFFNS
jgi:UDP-2-acetamido-2-deoxy-ribo-hexuluronate aminotransferase